MARKVAWGIDIGESAVKAVKLRRVGDSVVIQDYRTIPCEARMEEAHAGDKEFRVRTALATLQRDVRLKGADVAVSIPGHDVFPRFIPLPPVEKKRIPEIVRYEARTQMPFPIDEVVWDYQPITGLDVPGDEVEVALFAIKKATVYGFLTNLRLAEMTPDLVGIAPLALYNFLMYDRSIDTGTVLIDVGAGNTDLVVIDGERFWTRNVSISGNDITRALQEKYQISFEEAESLKRKAAASKQAEKLFGAMRPILDDLIGEIQRSIGYYKAQTRNVRIEQIILLGNAFKLPRLVDYFRQSLDYEVTLLEHLTRVKTAGSSDAEKFEPELPSYGVAIGLALQALGLGRIVIDMMPAELVRERLLRQKIPYAAAVAALLAVPLFLGYTSASREIVRCDEKLKPVMDEIKKYQAEIAKENAVKNLGKVATDMAMLEQTGQHRANWLLFLDSLNKGLNALRRDEYLLNSVREVSGEELLKARAPAGRAAGAQAAPGDSTLVELVFEKDTTFSAADLRRLRELLEAQPYILSVDGREETRVGEPGGAGSARIVDRGGQGWVKVFWVTFSTKRAAPPGGPAGGGAPTGPAKGPGK